MLRLAILLSSFDRYLVCSASFRDRGHGMHRKLIAVLLLTLICLVVAACDPGMTIGERPKGTSQATLPEGCTLELHAKDTRQLIGESWYDPEVTVRNLGESPVAIDRIELRSQGVTYRLEQWAEKDL